MELANIFVIVLFKMLLLRATLIFIHMIRPYKFPLCSLQEYRLQMDEKILRENERCRFG